MQIEFNQKHRKNQYLCRFRQLLSYYNTFLNTTDKTCNLALDRASEKSTWRFYREILHLRKNHPALTVGSFAPVAPRDTNYCAFTRTDSTEQFLIVCNFETAQELDVPGAWGKLVLSNYGLDEKTDQQYAPYKVAAFKKELGS